MGVEETQQLPYRIDQHGVVYRDRNQSINRMVANFEGFAKEYFVSDYGERAAVIVVRGSDVLLSRQYRLLINGLSHEIPGGRIDQQEAAHEAAVRECVEETGVRCTNLRPLLNFHPSIDTLKNYTSIFWTDESEMVDQQPGRCVWVSLEQCLKMIIDQQIVDSLSIIALLAYQQLRIGSAVRE